MRKDIIYIGNRLASRGFTPTAVDILPAYFEQMGFNVLAASDKRNKVARWMQMMYVLIKNRKAKVVLVDTYSTMAYYYAYSIALLCRLIGLKYIPLLHGGNLPYRLNNSPKSTGHIFRYSYANIAVSKFIQEAMQAKGFDTFVIENGIEINKYPFLHRKKVYPSLLWVRSFDEIYNPKMALYVLQAIKAIYPNATLTMVGPDKDGSLARCINICNYLELKESVAFTGKLTKEEWVALSANHDIFINTSNIDNQPVSILEAMALGMIVVSTDAGGIPQLIVNRENGYVVPANDATAMANTIADIMNDEGSGNERVSNNARKTAEQHDWNIIKLKWQKVLDELIYGNT